MHMDGMRQTQEVDQSIFVKKPLAMRALRRSCVRKKIADYLFDIGPNGSYTADIAYRIQTTPTNVIGAIRGMDERYKDDESLLNLTIVEEIINEKNTKIYKLTDFGKELIISMNKQK